MTNLIKKTLILGAFFSVCWGYTGSAFAARLSADDFLPPVQAETDVQEAELTKVQEPAAVKKEAGIDAKPAIKANSAQDAINAFVESGEAGCVQINFPSGIGFVSTGVSTYTYMQNKTATTIAQRNAYVKAYTEAKKELAATLQGMTSEGMTALFEQMQTLTTSEKDLTNLQSMLAEGTAEMVSGMLRGYVVYNVQDVQEGTLGTVSVTIVTTPKTMGDFKRPDLNSISASSIRDGLNHVLVELEQGIVPPVGGKTIAIPQTGEIAFVAFGSAVVRQNSNPAVQKKQFLNATKIAKMRARNALVGILQGDNISSVAAEAEDTQDMTKEYDTVVKTDPITQKHEKSYVQLQEQTQSFKNSATFNEAISSLRRGAVPPGVSVRTFPNKEKTLVTGFAIYIPSMTKQAQKAAKQMQALSPMTNTGEESGTSAGAISGGGEISFGVKSGSAPSQGATGRVSNDADL